jgi:hypothetical protein
MELFKVELAAVEVVVEQRQVEAASELNELNLTYACSGGMGDVIGI